MVSAQAWELGDAPRRFEPQDASGWSYELTPKAARTRDQVGALYETAYVPAGSVALAWSGSIGACDPGVTNADHQQAVIARVNYFRALADLPPVALMSGAETLRCRHRR